MVDDYQPNCITMAETSGLVRIFRLEKTITREAGRILVVEQHLMYF